MALAEDKSKRLLDIEESLEAQCTKPMRTVLAQFLVLLDLVWPGDDASIQAKRKALARVDLTKFDKASVGVVDKLIDGAERALSEGYASGLGEAKATGVDVREVFKASVSGDIVEAARKVPGVVTRKVKLGKAALSTATTLTDAQAAIAVAASSINDVARTARYVSNKAANEGLAFVADLDPDLVTVWHPERDACIDCLNRAGDINPKRLPPQHPNCRCDLWVLEAETAKGIAAGLVREAQRSILRGWSQPSESNKKRIDAARKLLAQNPRMPKSVKEYARTAIKRGEFPRGRDFPGVR